MLVGTKGKILADVYGDNVRLLPTSRKESVPQKYARVEGQAQGHWSQWVDACLSGYGNRELSAPFEISGPLTEALLVANLAIRGACQRIDHPGEKLHPLWDETIVYPGRNLKLLWDHETMRVTNFDMVNQFVKREYRLGWEVNYTL